ncbi:MAG: hypothetical protein AB7E48_05735 [Deferribacterales bacterium]
MIRAAWMQTRRAKRSRVHHGASVCGNTAGCRDFRGSKDTRVIE